MQQLQLPSSQRLCMSAPTFKRKMHQLDKLFTNNANIISSTRISLSSMYNENDDKSYLSQCFDNLSLLGEGSFGRAISVRSLEDNKYYAVKFTLGPCPSPRIRDLRVGEIKKHESIPDHPNLVKLFCAWEEKGHFFLQMELCEKRSLDLICDINPKPKIGDSLVWGYFIDILLAVSHLHRNNLIHCDIKPANVFLTENNVCKLGDFGLLFNEKTDVRHHDMDEGDGKYLAFEAFDVGPSKAGDMFSLGITLLELSCEKILPKGCDRFWLQNGRVIDEYVNSTFFLKPIINI